MLKNKLKNFRLKRNMTQVQLADKLNIHEFTYKRYESNMRIPKVDVALTIAKVLNTTVEDLFEIQSRQTRESNKPSDKKLQLDDSTK